MITIVDGLLRRGRDRWNGFFFRPVSPASIGLFRIVFGCVIFLSVLGKLPCRELFYGEAGIVSYATMSRYFTGPPLLYFRWVPAGDPALLGYFLGLLAATLSLIVGFQSRLSSVLVFLGIISLSNRNFFVDNSGDDLLRINCFFLMFTEAGAAFSVDRWLRVRHGLEGPDLVPRPPWAQRMLQLQLSYLYLNTFYLKLPGKGWQDGTALYYALNYVELQRFSFRYFFYFLWQIKLATYGVMVAEFSVGALVWIRKLRYPCLVAAFFLHFGINLSMQFPVFQYVMMSSLICFIHPEDVETAVNWLRKRVLAGQPVKPATIP